MGRKRKYETTDQKRNAKREDNKLYYERHREEIKRKRMEYYWKQKGMDKIVINEKFI